MRVFVTGTDTDVGKTLVSAWLCKHFGCDYFKPVQAGLWPRTDSEWVKAHVNCHTHPESYRFHEPASPHYAARLEGQTLSLAQIRLPVVPRLVVEGAGGVLVPLEEGRTMLDLIRALALPVLVVASTRLGTLNHTLLTLQALRSYGISVPGVILNGGNSDMTAQTIEDYGGTSVLQQLPLLPEVTASALGQLEPSAALRAALSNLSGGGV